MLVVTTLLMVVLPFGGNYDQAANRTVIGPDNRFLSDGSTALLAGDYAEGVRLTEIGLRFVRNEEEAGSAHNNLCAGLIKLSQPELALEHCDTALEIDPQNWHAYSNKAAALLHMDRLDEAEKALEKGLAINPNSRTMLKVLDAARSMRYTPTVTVVDEK